MLYLLYGLFGTAASAFLIFRLPPLFQAARWQRTVFLAGCVNLFAAIALYRNSTAAINVALLMILVNGLFLNSLTDINEQMIYRALLIPIWIFGGIAALCSPERDWIARFAFCVALSGVMLLIARRASLGTGDAKLIAVLALFFPYNELAEVLFCAFGVSLMFGLVYAVVKKQTLKVQLPFVPFLLAGVLIKLTL